MKDQNEKKELSKDDLKKLKEIKIALKYSTLMSLPKNKSYDLTFLRVEIEKQKWIRREKVLKKAFKYFENDVKMTINLMMFLKYGYNEDPQGFYQLIRVLNSGISKNKLKKILKNLS